jgi:protein-L-isoaspartate(D-aspartate) O-methyltransferase
MDRRAAESLLSEIEDPRVREAFLSVDRAEFVRPADRAYAWSDCALKIEGGATISQPSLVAYMTEQLATRPEHRVLEIGTGSGYQTAILAALVSEVYSIEVHPLLSEHAAERLRAHSNLHLLCGDGRRGWPEHAPFDRILGTVAFPKVPRTLIDQLTPEGCLLAPIGQPHGRQWLTLCQCHAGRTKTRRLIPVRFLSLRR